ncbi:polyketide synthase-5 [Diaporthe helianthi]|uniref:Polyketide synthase 2 n=1 Tax=Diaporthe helianthi TaxID=158607 RepID=A0A1C1WZH7_DIAHE|nr:polyketide synthase 2 [Diaporthe helianthi]POS74346.1 polyketide synthase-5 [Diaporthe helianthi]
MAPITVTEPPHSDAPEPIAIIGMGCRWPGDSETPSELWDYLESKSNSYSKFPKDRINGDAFFHTDGNRPGSFKTEGGCFLKSDVRQFDASFFGIHPKEVLTLDPAQRKFLEVVYEAFESAGVPLRDLSGSNTGTFVGNFNYDHQLMHYRDPENALPYSVTGSGITILSNRINYLFNLKGPSMTLDTACSSSMYALHLACSAIQSGDCDSAVVGGTNLILTPECQIFSSVLGAVSPTSVCHTFDSRADGYARADGIGALYIKRLSRAVADGDPIRAVIRGTAFNANGRTGGITHPSPDGQEACIRRAYERAGGLDMSLTGYFECHGTGTPVGDPIEVSALGRIFADGKTAANPLLIGSVKSNMGHSEPSSGIAGVMKAVLAIERGVIPPTIGIETLNPNIDLKDGRLKIVTESTPWPDLPVRRASVNSFGYGGSNAHVILESAETLLPGYRSTHQTSKETSGLKALANRTGLTHQPPRGYITSKATPRGVTNGNTNGHVNGGTSEDGVEGHLVNGTKSPPSLTSKTQFLLPFSAHDENTLRANYGALAKSFNQWNPQDVAYTLSVRRSLFHQRAFVIANTTMEACALTKEPPSAVKVPATASPTVGFVLTGQGAQWPRMGARLMAEYPSCLATVRRLDRHLDDLDEAVSRDWSIEEVLEQEPERSLIHQAEITQPLVTALQIMLINLLAKWEVLPRAVIGHSSGEIAAGYAAGLLTEQEAMIAAYLRGQAISENKAPGLMMAVGGHLSDIQPLVHDFDSKVTIACHNSPESHTLSGDAESILSLKAALDENKVFCRILQTSNNAYHSDHMRALGPRYQRDLDLHMPKKTTANSLKQGLKARPSQAVFFSSVFGQAAPWSILGSKYWRQNLESPVLFHQGVSEMLKKCPVDILIEVGPHGALQGPLRQLSKTMSDGVKFPTYYSAITRGRDNVTDVLTLAGNLFTYGYDINLGRVNATESRGGNQYELAKVITDLPRYQWQYPSDVLLYENRYTREWRLRMHPRHDILGSRLPGTNRLEPMWRNKLSVKNVPWLADHRIGKDIVFPSTGYLSMVLEAATQLVELEGLEAGSIECYDIQNVSLSRALMIPEDDFGVETLLTLRPASINATSRHKWLFDFVLTSVATENDVDSFTENCRGQVQVDLEQYGTYVELQPMKCPRLTLADFPESEVMKSVRESLSKKTINAGQWYESFASVGLCYGPMFQGLSNVFSLQQRNTTQARVGLEPTAKAMKGESRYLLHPATLDASLQLSILSAHDSKATKFKRAFMPTAFESVKVWPRATEYARGFPTAEAYAKGTLKGVRGLSSDIVLLGGPRNQRMLEATNIFLTAADQTAPKLIEDPAPYTRIVWKPEFDHLTSDMLAKMYPPLVLSDDAVIPSLNHLALHQLIHFRETHRDIFAQGSDQPHLQRLLDWTTDKLSSAENNPDSPASSIVRYDAGYRAEEIERLSRKLKGLSSEARLMCHLYENLPAIYSGEKSGIQVALQDNLLLDNYETGQVYREGNRRLAETVALYAHQNPGLRILEVGAGTGSATNQILPALKGESIWRQYSEYRFTDTTPSFLAGAEERFSSFGGMTFGTFDMEASAESQGYQGDYDLVVASNVIHATSDIRSTLINVRNALKPGGKMILLELTQSQLSAGLVLGTFSDFWKADNDPSYPRYDGPFLSKSLWQTVLPDAGFSGLDFYLDDYSGANISTTVICASAAQPLSSIPRQPAPQQQQQQQDGITLVYRSEPAQFMQQLADCITETYGVPADLTSLAEIETVAHSRFIFLLETEGPFFLDVKESEWKLLQSALSRSKSSLWLTVGDLLSGNEPLYAMVSGLARGMRTENSSLRFSILDLERTPNAADLELFRLIGQLESRVADTSRAHDDTEFRYKNGILHMSRLVADDALCEEAKGTAHPDNALVKVPLRDFKSTPLQLAIEKPGVLSTVYFKQDHEFSKPIAADEVEIEVKYAGVNNKDIAVLTGRHHSDSLSDECSGIITRVGSDVKNLAVGDSVYCQSFSRFGNFVREKAAFCQRLEGGDTLEGTATLPIAFCTAIYGLMDLGRLEKGESVLIQSATGAVGLAALQISHMLGAEIFATVGTEEKKAELLQMGFGIEEDHVFSSRDRFSARRLLEKTSGKGIDVILCSARGELMHDYWRCVATGGRFVEIGRTEVLDNGSLSLGVFGRNATFTSFDLEVLSKTKPQVTARLMTTIQRLKREGHITPLPSRTFDVAEIDAAFMTFTKGTHIGKLLVEYDDESENGISVQQDPFSTKFDPEASYLLVGCLGGLGRSFSNWAVSRGARHLVYLSRSGAVSAEAQDFLAVLAEKGVDARVVKGDVTSLADVEAAVAAAPSLIKGVVQGALTLHDGLFESMSLERFHGTVRPRVVGTLNLDAATRDCPLDFFQLWSSWTVVFGTATQANYLASNAFLDAFARHRRARGLPCTSLALSQVLGIGIVSYIPEYQQAMLRNGFYGNDEDEFLQYCEKGLLPAADEQAVADTDPTFKYDPQTVGHLLVGIEPAGLRNVARKYPLSDMAWYHDPRFQNIIQATDILSSQAGTQDKQDVAAEEGTALDRVKGKLSRLLYIPIDEVDPDKAINHYGIDSMVAAELRNWFMSSFGKEVSMLKLLSENMTLQKLAEEATNAADE